MNLLTDIEEPTGRGTGITRGNSLAGYPFIHLRSRRSRANSFDFLCDRALNNKTEIRPAV